MSMYASYYNEARTHLALGKDTPITRPIERFGRIIAEPMLGDMHHPLGANLAFGTGGRQVVLETVCNLRHSTGVIGIQATKTGK